MTTSQPNNFNLLRLLAALQVVLGHSALYFHLQGEWLSWLAPFPGVPIFFFISGFLIYRSYCNLQDNRLKVFYTNRFLRLYPGLYFCLLLICISVLASGYLQAHPLVWSEFLRWLLGSLTFYQIYNPPFLRDYGTGAINWSLWTIVVELQFYFLTPFIFILFTRYKKLAVLVFLAFVGVNIFNSHLNPKVSTLEKMLNLSFAPSIFMFMIGAYLSSSRACMDWILRINPVFFLIAYVLAYQLSIQYNLGIGNDTNVLSFALLACLIFRLAYTLPQLSSRLLGDNDISYGIYIFHMPVINFLIYKQFGDTYASLGLTLAVVICISLVSWKLIEKPALALKKKSSYRHV